MFNGASRVTFSDVLRLLSVSVSRKGNAVPQINKQTPIPSPQTVDENRNNKGKSKEKAKQKSTLITWIRDLVIGAVVVSAFLAWQQRDLLKDDGSVTIAEQNFVSLDGSIYPLVKNDKQTVLYFFAPWCSICRYSIGNLSVLDENQYNIVRVALDYQSIEEVQQFVDSVGVQGHVLLGTSDHKAEFKIAAYPTYYVLDKELNVVSNDMGYSSTLGIKWRTQF